jgi:hypothetical protein
VDCVGSGGWAVPEYYPGFLLHPWRIHQTAEPGVQFMDVVFAVGQYHVVSMSLNTFGVQLDKGVKSF